MPPPVRLSRSEPIELRLKCVGLTRDEFMALYRDFNYELPGAHSIRNPTPVTFDPNTVHELLVHIPWALLLSYAGKKALDKASDIAATLVQNRLNQSRADQKKTVTLYGPDGRPRSKVTLKPEKIRRR